MTFHYSTSSVKLIICALTTHTKTHTICLLTILNLNFILLYAYDDVLENFLSPFHKDELLTLSLCVFILVWIELDVSSLYSYVDAQFVMYNVICLLLLCYFLHLLLLLLLLCILMTHLGWISLKFYLMNQWITFVCMCVYFIL